MSEEKWSLEKALPKDIPENLPSPLPFFHLIEKLKTTPRTGWVYHNVPHPESISDHMYRMAIISFLAPSELDQNKCIKMSLVHDMAESIVGDITPIEPISKEEKHARELKAIEHIKNSLLYPQFPTSAETIYELWNEYESGNTPESRFVKDVDKFECLLQMVEYERSSNGTLDLSEFKSVLSSIKSPYVNAWVSPLLKEYEELKEKHNKSL